MMGQGIREGFVCFSSDIHPVIHIGTGRMVLIARGSYLIRKERIDKYGLRIPGFDQSQWLITADQLDSLKRLGKAAIRL